MEGPCRFSARSLWIRRIGNRIYPLINACRICNPTKASKSAFIYIRLSYVRLKSGPGMHKDEHLPQTVSYVVVLEIAPKPLSCVFSVGVPWLALRGARMGRDNNVCMPPNSHVSG